MNFIYILTGITRSKGQKPSRQTKHILGLRRCIGCIYISKFSIQAQYNFNFNFSLESIIKCPKHIKNIFSDFCVFLQMFVLMLFLFLFVIYCTKVCIFASALSFDSESRKHLSVHQLYLVIWPPDAYRY